MIYHMWCLILCVNWPWVFRLNVISGVSVIVLAWDLYLNWWTQWSRLPFPTWVEIMQSVEGLNTKNLRGWRNLLFLPCFTDWAGTFHLICSSSWTGIYAISSPGSQTFELGLNDMAGFPGSSFSRWQIVGLLYFHNHMNQFIIINCIPPTCPPPLFLCLNFVSILLVLFLWRTQYTMQIFTISWHGCINDKVNFKDLEVLQGIYKRIS